MSPQFLLEAAVLCPFLGLFSDLRQELSNIPAISTGMNAQQSLSERLQREADKVFRQIVRGVLSV
jgi:hypothetical protein